MADKLINVIDPITEDVGSIPESQFAQAKQDGYKIASPEDINSALEREKYTTPKEKLKTFGRSALSSATFGLSKGIETKVFGTPGEEIRKGEEYNPSESTAGSIVGLVGTSFAPGLGEAGLLEKGAAETGEAIAKKVINPLSAQSVMTGVSEKAANAIGLKGLPAWAAKGALEGGMYQAGDELGKAFTGDPNQTIQTAATNIGLAGMLTAPFGALTGGVGSLFEAKVGNKMNQFVSDLKSRMNEHLKYPNPLETLSSELQTRLASSGDVFDEVYGPKGLKADAISKLMPENLSDNMVESAQGSVAKAKALSMEMERNPDLFPAHLKAGFNRDLNIFLNQMSEPAAPNELFNGLQEFKQRLQEYLPKKGQFITTVSPEYEFINKIRGLSGELRTNLENPEIWGKAGEVQQTINKAFSQYLPALKDFQRKFMSKIGGEFEIDPGKLQTYLNQSGKAGQKLKQEMLGNFLEADNSYRSAIDKVHEKLGIQSPFPESSLHYSNSTLGELTPGAKTADAIMGRALSRLSGEAGGAAIGGTIGHMFGATGFGALIGEHALGPFLSQILPNMIKPLMEAEANGMAMGSVAKMASAFLNGETVVNKALKGLFKGSQEVLPSKLIPSEKELNKLNTKLKELQMNPNQLVEQDHQMAHYMPNHGIAMTEYQARAVQTLNSLRPNTEQQFPLDSDVKLSSAEKAQYNRVLSIAQQPLMILNHLKDATITPQDVEIFKTLNPDLYASISKKMMQNLIEMKSDNKTIPYSTRMGISLFLGQPLDATMSTPSLQMTQASFHINSSPNQQAQMPMKHSMNALQKMPGMEQTAGQRSESRRLK